MKNPFSKQQVLSIVQNTLVNVMGCDADELAPDAALINDLDADSLDFVDLRYNLEKQLVLLLPQKSVLDHLEEFLGDASQVTQNGKITGLAAYALQHSFFQYTPEQVKAGMRPLDVLNVATVQNWANLCHGILDHLPEKCPECGHTQANIGTNGKAVCGSCASILKPLSGDEAMSLDIRRIIHEWQLNGVPA